MAIHEEESPLAGATVTLTDGYPFTIGDWWDRISSEHVSNDPLVVFYESRRQMHNLPNNNNVLYGWRDGDEFLINTCEIVDFQSLS